MNKQDFLLEIRTEEIPAETLTSARLDLLRGVVEALSEEGLAAESSESFATPRRLTVILKGLPERQADRLSEVAGPAASVAYDADGQPTRAALGFARAQQVDVSDLTVVDSPRGKTVVARRPLPGRSARELLSQRLPRVVSSLTFPKTMRWGAGRDVFVRPVRGILALLGGEIVPLEMFGVSASNSTVGHRLLADAEFLVSDPGDYLARLRAAFVEPDGEVRRTRILETARREAQGVGGTIEAEADLASLLANLVEWPGVVRGSFDPEFLDLPEEITTTAMRTHQKYFPVRGKTGLLPYFVAVMDNTEDRKGLIAKGNEWVLNARLADARFFYQEDTRQALESRMPDLERLTFQERLGDYRRKTERLEELAETIAHVVGRPDLIEPVGLAARLSKLDLSTRMVKEFTDLQGVVGGIYARREGLPEVVWKAVYDQYRPASATDDLPRDASGAILTLADRFDTLAGFFSIGAAPTGSKDPYGLRRAAYGLVSVVISRRWRLDWRPVARKALALYPSDVAAVPAEQALTDLERFFAERLRNLFERRGHTYDEISAVTNVGVWDFADAAERALALSEARREMDFRSLILAFKRIRNIVAGEEPGAPQFDLLREDAERQLAGDFLQVRQTTEELARARRYREAMEMIASIAPSLDHFFVKVLVHSPEEELRRNRLALLHAIQKEFSRLADFSEIVVEK